MYFAIYNFQFFDCLCVRFAAENLGFYGKTPSKTVENGWKKPFFALKTSDFSGKNIRTFPTKHRNFSPKSPMFLY